MPSVVQFFYSRHNNVEYLSYQEHFISGTHTEQINMQKNNIM